MTVTVFFEHGQVVGMQPAPKTSCYEERDLINNATLIVSDGVCYDLTDANSIHSIPVPDYLEVNDHPVSSDMGVTGYLDYVLRMHSGCLWNNGEYNLSISCLRQACLLMLYSPIAWQRKDYYRIVNSFISLGRFKKANEWKQWIEKNVPSSEDFLHDAFQRILDSCRELDTDLIEVDCNGPCCSVCARYRNRIYSLSGRDRRFPHFPKDFHFGCVLNEHPFIDGVMDPSFDCRNYVRHSNRPFVDDRTAEEKRAYADWQERLSSERDREHAADLNRIAFYWLKAAFPYDAPRSLSAFSKMRNTNSQKYQALAQKVEAAGYQIPNSLEEAAKWEDENN